MRKNRAFRAALASAALTTSLAFASLPASSQQLQHFPVTSLNVGIHLIKAEVATTEAQREQGLMFREKMGSNEGMVFQFGAPQGICMWMKNTLIPLSVAFIDETGKIINIEEMKAQTLDSHCAQQPAFYALEMNKGWFKQKNIKPGTVIEGLPKQ
ncbi:DUF192 domain-containing protein [Paraherbaspirillum soli]|uniref:DUF192 domain-containing protein n=1 Tax=Paraherbaspirillum soli TaxID=631222 RepID=A0ABW0MDB5_9BURK